jgi:hypothetical protein
LLHPDADLDLDRPLPTNAGELLRDLGLDDVVAGMAGTDPVIAEVARHTLLTSLTDPDVISYRQAVLRDALAHPELFRTLYRRAEGALLREQHVYHGLVSNPSSVLKRATDVLDLAVEDLRRLRDLATGYLGQVRSPALAALLTTLRDDLDEPTLAAFEAQVQQLRFRDGVVVSARLGLGCRATDLVLRAGPARGPVLRRLRTPARSSTTIRIDDASDVDRRALTDLREQALGDAAQVMGDVTDEVLGFLTLLRQELGFYVGCLALHDRLRATGAPVCFPEPSTDTRPVLVAGELYDAGLGLRTGERVVGNDVTADGVPLVMVTGANQGGKSTFLRSVGLAQLMLQAGMFVPARSFRATVAARLFTHVERNEDTTMRSGRLDAELREMRAIDDQLAPGDLLLCNESFSSTNEREGSLLAHGIVRALIESGVRVVYVTHLFDLARSLHEDDATDTCFLRAERRDDGTRTFKLLAGPPLPTSFGEDLYRRIFGEDGTGTDRPPVEPPADERGSDPPAPSG